MIYSISFDSPIRECLKLLEKKQGLPCPVVDKDGKVLGIVSDGDIRRFIINGGSLDSKCIDCANKKFYKCFVDEKISVSKLIEFGTIPIIDKNFKLIGIRTFKNEEGSLSEQEDVAIIMAGGFGTRLRPLTNSIPKPLLKLGNLPIIEHIIINFRNSGIKNFYISVNYLSEKIKEYLGYGQKFGVDIKYVYEQEPLGTAGSISSINNYDFKNIIVINGDIYTSLNMNRFKSRHLVSENDLTIATTIYKHSIPFGVFELVGDSVSTLYEKPTYSYNCNAGIYFMKKEILDLLPKNKFFNMTDFIQKLILGNFKVGIYPMDEYWADIGNITELQKNEKLENMLSSFYKNISI